MFDNISSEFLLTLVFLMLKLLRSFACCRNKFSFETFPCVSAVLQIGGTCMRT